MQIKQGHLIQQHIFAYKKQLWQLYYQHNESLLSCYQIRHPLNLLLCLFCLFFWLLHLLLYLGATVRHRFSVCFSLWFIKRQVLFFWEVPVILGKPLSLIASWHRFTASRSVSHVYGSVLWWDKSFSLTTHKEKHMRQAAFGKLQQLKLPLPWPSLPHLTCPPSASSLSVIYLSLSVWSLLSLPRP